MLVLLCQYIFFVRFLESLVISYFRLYEFFVFPVNSNVFFSIETMILIVSLSISVCGLYIGLNLALFEILGTGVNYSLATYIKNSP